LEELEKVDVERLYVDSCLVDSVYYNFGAESSLEEVQVFPTHKKAEEEQEYPMMNYLWRLGDFYDRQVADGRRDPREDGKKLDGLPTVLVHILDMGHGIALTGGGMDLSWEIAESYIRLGYLPPFKVAKLPNLAGKRDTNRNRTIINACKRTFESVGQRSERAIGELDRIKEKLG